MSKSNFKKMFKIQDLLAIVFGGEKNRVQSPVAALPQIIYNNSQESNSQQTVNPDRGFLQVATFRNNCVVITAQCDSSHSYQHDRVSASAFTIHNTNPIEIQT